MSFFLSDLFDKDKVKKEFLKEAPVYVPEKKNYDVLEPGTPEWMEVWKMYPELQEKMVEYAKKKVIWCEHREQRVNVLVCVKRCKICLE